MISVYRFTRALFGLTCSPFLLGGVLNEHLKTSETRHSELVKEIRNGLYVDDLMTRGVNTEEVGEKKSKAIEVFDDARFKLHKCHSNLSEFEATEPEQNETTSHDGSTEEVMFAKQQLGTDQRKTSDH